MFCYCKDKEEVPVSFKMEIMWVNQSWMSPECNTQHSGLVSLSSGYPSLSSRWFGKFVVLVLRLMVNHFLHWQICLRIENIFTTTVNQPVFLHCNKIPEVINLLRAEVYSSSQLWRAPLPMVLAALDPRWGGIPWKVYSRVHPSSSWPGSKREEKRQESWSHYFLWGHEPYDWRDSP